MRSMAKVTSLAVCLVWVVSCGLVTSDPTQTPVPTGRPTSTLAPTATLEPTSTSAPTEASAPAASPTETEGEEEWPIPEPQGEPVSEWKGIPVMGEAIAGEENDEVYVYTVAVDAKEVERYYIEVMPRFGWELFAASEGDDIDYSPFMMFQKGELEKAAAVMLVVNPDNNLTYVLLNHQE